MEQLNACLDTKAYASPLSIPPHPYRDMYPLTMMWKVSVKRQTENDKSLAPTIG